MCFLVIFMWYHHSFTQLAVTSKYTVENEMSTVLIKLYTVIYNIYIHIYIYIWLVYIYVYIYIKPGMITKSLRNRDTECGTEEHRHEIL